MAYTVVLDDIPKALVAGNSLSWKKSLSEFPATEWTLTYALVNADAFIKITATADGNDHLVEIPPTTSDDYTPGDYEYQAYVENSDSSERYKVEQGQFRVLTDFESQTTGHDARSWVKKTLDYVEDLIQGKAQKDRASYSVAGRSLSAYSWDEIYKLRSDLLAQYKAEKRAKRKKNSTAYVRFE